MADVRSKNVYELLGNDPELDPDREPEPPTRAVDRPVPRLGKRDAPKEPSTRPSHSESNARRGSRHTGNEAAFRDRNAGSQRNRERPVDEGKEPQRRGFHAREDRGGRVRNDRQSRTGVTDTPKQITQGWGVGGNGQKEWDEERAGEAIARNEENEPQATWEETKEPADLTKSFAAYQAEKAAQEDLSAKASRNANEGNRNGKQWAEAKELKRDGGDDEYIKGKEKSKREKQRKEKNFLEVDMRFVEPARGANGPRGGRGGRGNGRGRGGRGGGRGDHGNNHGSYATSGPTVDETNFPSLGS